MNLNKKDLISKIENAWGSVKYPGDKKIFTPDSYDNEGITDYFAGTTWKGHSIENLRRHSAAISSFFTPIAWHYWLPAYLIAENDLDTPHFYSSQEWKLLEYFYNVSKVQ